MGRCHLIVLAGPLRARHQANPLTALSSMASSSLSLPISLGAGVAGGASLAMPASPAVPGELAACGGLSPLFLLFHPDVSRGVAQQFFSSPLSIEWPMSHCDLSFRLCTCFLGGMNTYPCLIASISDTPVGFQFAQGTLKVLCSIDVATRSKECCCMPA